MSSNTVKTFNEVVKDVPDGKWVILSSDRQEIVAEGYTVDEVRGLAKGKGVFGGTATRVRHFHYPQQKGARRKVSFAFMIGSLLLSLIGFALMAGEWLGFGERKAMLLNIASLTTIVCAAYCVQAVRLKNKFVALSAALWLAVGVIYLYRFFAPPH